MTLGRAFVATTLVLSACGGSDAGGPGSVELGAGEASFGVLEDGQRVPLIAGSQGGFHVWISFRAHGFVGPRLQTTIVTELVEDSAVRLSSELSLKLSATADGGLEFIGWPGVLDTTVCPIDREVDIRIVLSEGRTVASDEKRVIVDGSATSRLPAACETAEGDAF